jgi:hypothetical protein
MMYHIGYPDCMNPRILERVEAASPKPLIAGTCTAHRVLHVYAFIISSIPAKRIATARRWIIQRRCSGLPFLAVLL